MIDYPKMEALVRRAGQLMLQARLTGDDVHAKQGDANFCTEYDLKIQRFLMEELRLLLPEAGFYGEEDTDGNRESLSGKEYIFYIDPIDGTTNFMFGYNHSCVSVGLTKNGQTVASFVYDPYVDELYKAFLGDGSWLNGRRLSVTDRSVEEGLVAFGCARHKPEGTAALFKTVQALFHRSLGIRSGGSATLELCRVASGSNAVFLEPRLEPYDYAAALLIVQEAGGHITQIDGSPMTLTAPCSVICGTPTAWQQAHDTLHRYQ